jgi:hypothetical protein
MTHRNLLFRMVGAWLNRKRRSSQKPRNCPNTGPEEAAATSYNPRNSTFGGTEPLYARERSTGLVATELLHVRRSCTSVSLLTRAYFPAVVEGLSRSSGGLDDFLKSDNLIV